MKKPQQEEKEKEKKETNRASGKCATRLRKWRKDPHA
jgi:hypothetical protein